MVLYSSHPYRILIIGDSGSAKHYLLLKLKNQRPDIDKIYWYVKNPFESKCQFLINVREKVGIEKLKNLKIFTDYSQAIHSVSENLED